MTNSANHVAFFTKIYVTRKWGDDHDEQYCGGSGEGSQVENCLEYVAFLRTFLCDNQITSVTDVGCGSFLVGDMIYSGDELGKIEYHGYDVYADLINRHQNKYKDRANFHFHHLDAHQYPEQLAGADVCILKDILQHWYEEEIVSFLDRIINLKLFRYILICNGSNQTADGLENGNRHRSHPLSARYLPLSKYHPKIIFCYEPDREVSLIDCREEG